MHFILSPRELFSLNNLFGNQGSFLLAFCSVPLCPMSPFSMFYLSIGVQCSQLSPFISTPSRSILPGSTKIPQISFILIKTYPFSSSSDFKLKECLLWMNVLNTDQVFRYLLFCSDLKTKLKRDDFLSQIFPGPYFWRTSFLTLNYSLFFVSQSYMHIPHLRISIYISWG